MQWITRSGLAHGGIAKMLHRAWLAKHGKMVDAEVRGIRYRLDISDNATDVKILISSKVYDGAELDHLSRASKGGVFVDIGANIGYYSLSLAKAGCPRVIAIEPNPPALDRLRFNIGVNRMEDAIEVVAAGVGPDCELEFYQTGGLGGSGFIKPDHDAPVIRVRAMPLLRILEERGITRVGGLKIDVEGFEDQVLLPFFEDAPDSLLPSCLVMESCHHGDWKNDLASVIAAKGYRIAGKTRANDIYVRP